MEMVLAGGLYCSHKHKKKLRIGGGAIKYDGTGRVGFDTVSKKNNMRK
jgi:hypothetical protein